MPQARALSVESLARDSGASSINENNVRYNREGNRAAILAACFAFHEYAAGSPGGTMLGG